MIVSASVFLIESFHLLRLFRCLVPRHRNRRELSIHCAAESPGLCFEKSSHTLGEATYFDVSTGGCRNYGLQMRKAADLGRDERRKRSAGDEAHDGGCVAAEDSKTTTERRSMR